MTTALQVINRAYSKIGVKRQGISLTDDEIDDGIIELNNMMLQLEASGTHINYTIITESSDLITCPDWSINYMSTNLAVRLAPDYDITPSPVLLQLAEEAEDVLIKRTSELGSVLYPNTLPIGSGNEHYYYERFFKDTSRDDLETGSGDQLTDTEDFHIQED